jgi:hypothetical protein
MTPIYVSMLVNKLQYSAIVFGRRETENIKQMIITMGKSPSHMKYNLISPF